MSYILGGSLSYSQLDKWEKSPKAFLDTYVYLKPRFETKYTKFGKEIHDKLQNDAEGFEVIPKYTLREHNFRKILKTEEGDIELHGYIDSYEPAEDKWLDYKNTKKWTEKETAENQQLVFYGLYHQLETGRLGKGAIVHLETVEDPYLRLSGNVNIMWKTITQTEVDLLKRRIVAFQKWCKSYTLQNQELIEQQKAIYARK